MHQPPELIDEVVVLYIVSMKVVVCGFCGKERSMTVCPHGVSKKELFLERSKTHRIFNLSLEDLTFQNAKTVLSQ